MRVYHLLFIGFGTLAATPWEGLLYNPSAKVLPPNNYAVSFGTGYFQTLENPRNKNYLHHIPMSLAADVGLPASAQVGLEFNSTLSFSLKASIWERGTSGVIPSLALGARSIFNNMEAEWFDVGAKDTLEVLTNEIYLAASSYLWRGFRLDYGALLNPGLERIPISFFFGVNQQFGPGIVIGYESFRRFGGFHHQFNLTFDIGDRVFAQFGATEIQSWMVQKSKWGFYTRPEIPDRDGYNSPGLRFQIGVRIGEEQKNDKSAPERVIRLEKRQGELEDKIKALSAEVEKTRYDVADFKKEKNQMRKMEESYVLSTLEKLASLVNSKAAYDPSEVTQLQNALMELKGSSRKYFSNVVQNAAIDADLRVQGLLIMARVERGEFNNALLKSTQDPEPSVRREAILILGKLGLKAASEYARNMLDDPDKSVVFAAKSTLQLLEAKNPGKKPSLKKLNLP